MHGSIISNLFDLPLTISGRRRSHHGVNTPGREVVRCLHRGAWKNPNAYFMDAAGRKIETYVEFAINRGRAFHQKIPSNLQLFDGF